MQGTKYAVFSVGGYDYGFDIRDVRIIEETIPVETAAKLPANIKGLLKLRGDVIPVCSLRAKFGLENIPAGDESRFIITSSHDMLIAYEVDEMKEIIDTVPEQLNEVPSIFVNHDTAYVKSVINVENKLIIVLNHDAILTEEEFSKLKTAIRK